MALTIETGKFAGQNAARLLGRLAFQMNLTMKSPGPEQVHDLRVAIRRFTQALTVFKPCFPGKERRKIQRRVKKLMVLAGTTRNCDVTLKLLGKSHSAQAAGLRPKMQSQRKESERALVAALRRRIERKSSLKWRAALEAALGAGEDGVCHTGIQETARRLLPQFAKDFLNLGDAAAEAKASPEKLHHFRIASKRFRYTLELFAPAYGASLVAWIDTIKHAQNLLGDLNDCVTAAELISSYKSKGRLAAWLKKGEHRKVEEFRAWWAEAFGGSDTVRRTWVRSLSHPQEGPGAARKPVARAASLRERIAVAGGR